MQPEVPRPAHRLLTEAGINQNKGLRFAWKLYAGSGRSWVV
ncbi:hypothetical protein [Verrucosispora sioxanthis]|nr:hypothetical protein [Verrucosispora sioxanthis]